MKYSLIAVSALSVFALAAPTPASEDNSCAYDKPESSYPDTYQGCLTHNLEEYQYGLGCKYYKPEIKECKHDDYGTDNDKVVSRPHTCKRLAYTVFRCLIGPSRLEMIHTAANIAQLKLLDKAAEELEKAAKEKDAEKYKKALEKAAKELEKAAEEYEHTEDSNHHDGADDSQHHKRAKPEKGEKAKPEKIQKTEKIGRSPKVEKVHKPEKAGKAEKAEKAEKTEKIGKRAKVQKADKPAKADKVPNPDEAAVVP